MRFGTIPEYQPGIRTCPQCGDNLVEDESAKDEPAYNPDDGAANRLRGRKGFAKRWFRRAPFLDVDTAGWIIDTYSWFLTHFGEEQSSAEMVLIEPSEEFFPFSLSRDHDDVRAVFEAVRSYAGMDTWPCSLEPQGQPLQGRITPGIVAVSESPDPLGTFSVPGKWEDGAKITYSPALASNPVQLVATFAHELAHYLLLTAEDPPPGGEALEEPATDLGSVFLGFGIFACNAAFSFRQYTDGDWIGWEHGGMGYLGEEELSFALALFILTHDIDPGPATKHLDANPRGFLSYALRQLGHAEDEIVRLRSLVGGSCGSQQAAPA
ncbi:MAG: hypothetical protein AAF430_18395 [Myxococcota bacterium]